MSCGIVFSLCREYLSLNEQLILRATAQRHQAFIAHVRLFAFSNVETQFLVELYLRLGTPFSTGRPLRIENIVVSNCEPVAWKVLTKQLHLLVNILGLDITTALINLDTHYLSIPLPHRKGN